MFDGGHFENIRKLGILKVRKIVHIFACDISLKGLDNFEPIISPIRIEVS